MQKQDKNLTECFVTFTIICFTIRHILLICHVLLNENGLINLRLIFALSKTDYNVSYLLFLFVFSLMFKL